MGCPCSHPPQFEKKCLTPLIHCINVISTVNQGDPMQYEINSASRLPIYQQLVQQVREAIARGDLKPEEQLPSVRQLSRDLVINPNTVARAYTELEREGLLNNRPGRGVFVAEPKDELTRDARRRRLLESLDKFLTEAVHLGFSGKRCRGSYPRDRDSFNGIRRSRARDERKGVSMTHAIVTERLTKYYGPRCVVNCLNLRVPMGTVYGFLGRNGAGKSTTIKMLLGMAQPNFGRVELLGHEIADLPPVVRGRIAYLAEGHPLYGWMTVAEAVRFGRSFHPDRWNQRLLDQILDHFEIPSRSKLRRLSNGQRANVALALAIAPDPDLLDSRRSHARSGYGRPPRFLDVDDSSRPAPGADDPLQLAYPGRRRARRRSDRHHGRRRAARRLSDRTLQAERDQAGARVRRPAAAFPGCAGLVQAWEVGRRLELVIVNFGAEQRQVIESLAPLAWDVVGLNLEDAFVDYTRGPRRSLPVFGEEHDGRSTAASDRGAA